MLWRRITLVKIGNENLQILSCLFFLFLPLLSPTFPFHFASEKGNKTKNISLFPLPETDCQEHSWLPAWVAKQPSKLSWAQWALSKRLCFLIGQEESLQPAPCTLQHSSCSRRTMPAAGFLCSCFQSLFKSWPCPFQHLHALLPILTLVLTLGLAPHPWFWLYARPQYLTPGSTFPITPNCHWNHQSPALSTR